MNHKISLLFLIVFSDTEGGYGFGIGYIILAGGKSKRLGHDKIKEVIGDMTLPERVITILSAFNGEIIIVTGENSSLPHTFS